jgi:membrane protein DedA with SNARE-associated domain
MTPLFAGVSRMKYRRFLPYNLASTVTWAAVYGAIGYAFGEYWDDLLAVARSVGFGFVALVVLSLAFYVYRRRARRAAKANLDKPKED